MQAIAKEARSDPALVKSAPHETLSRRLDEVKAARELVLAIGPRLRTTDARQERQMAGPADTTQLRRTALYDLHVRLGARMVPFAGYDMPVQYPSGNHQRASAHPLRCRPV